MMQRVSVGTILIVLVAVFAFALVGCQQGGGEAAEEQASQESSEGSEQQASAGAGEDYRFVIIPKVVHPWFDKVDQGAKDAAELLSQQTGGEFTVDYRAPQSADVTEQNQILERAIATQPDGIAIDLLDAPANKPVLQEARDQGIEVVIFDSEPPEGMGLDKVGNDFHQQAAMAAEKLVELLDGEGQVAIMQGVPTAPNHRIRFEAHKEVFDSYPDIEIVATGIDNDSIEQAQEQANSIISAHPDLDGFVACDAAGPIGIGLAVKEAGKVGDITVVGLDDLNQLIELIREGVVHSSYSTKPMMQGHWSVMALWQLNLGQNVPDNIDTGIAVITQDDVEGGYEGY
jgi:ribose transport system substrate-binding protein